MALIPPSPARAGLLLAGALLLEACGSDDDGGTAPPRPRPPAPTPHDDDGRRSTTTTVAGSTDTTVAGTAAGGGRCGGPRRPGRHPQRRRPRLRRGRGPARRRRGPGRRPVRPQHRPPGLPLHVRRQRPARRLHRQRRRHRLHLHLRQRRDVRLRGRRPGDHPARGQQGRQALADAVDGEVRTSAARSPTRADARTARSRPPAVAAPFALTRRSGDRDGQARAEGTSAPSPTFTATARRVAAGADLHLGHEAVARPTGEAERGLDVGAGLVGGDGLGDGAHGDRHLDGPGAGRRVGQPAPRRSPGRWPWRSPGPRREPPGWTSTSAQPRETLALHGPRTRCGCRRGPSTVCSKAWSPSARPMAPAMSRRSASASRRHLLTVDGEGDLDRPAPSGRHRPSRRAWPGPARAR